VEQHLRRRIDHLAAIPQFLELLGLSEIDPRYSARGG
jgi:hypothetical protein